MTTYYTDTNVFLRFLLQDNDQLFQLSKRYFTRAAAGEITICVLSEIIPELVYVLEKIYSLSADEITKCIGSIIRTPYFQVEQRQAWMRSLELYQVVDADIVDIFLAVKANEGKVGVLSFDKDFKKIDRALRKIKSN
jgi:predicted nucleic-acid-binding protein